MFLILFNCISFFMYAQTKDTTWSKPYKGLVVGITGTSEKDLEIFLKNTNQKDSIEVWSHVDCGNDFHFDWYTIKLISSTGEKYQLKLMDSREKSTPISKTLRPGQMLSHKINLKYWISSFNNGGLNRFSLLYPQYPTKYQTYIRYAVNDKTKKWQGEIKAGPHTIEIK